MKKNLIAILFITILLLTSGFQQQSQATAPADTIITNTLIEQKWVDSLFNSMSLDEHIGQLMSIRAHSDKGPEHVAKVEKLIKNYHVGGLTFFQGTPEKQVDLTNRFQKLAKRVPLMIAMDAEWGVGMRYKSIVVNFPRELLLGAIQDNRLIYKMGAEVAKQFHRLGMHINFAPVADVNNNPENPVINTRSFGEDRYNVAVKTYMYAKGMEDNGVLACAKHFPGHGDTDTDSHYDLPVITHDRERLDSIELFPFRVMAQHGVGSMMIAHLHVPSLDDTPNLPTSLSRPTVTDLLRKKWKYDGLIFTDGLGMKGVTKHYKNGEVEAKSLVAGNDILLLPQDVAASVREIKRYLKEGWLDQAQFEASVKRVLRAKYRLGLTKFKTIEKANVRADINHPKAIALKRELIQNALTLVRNPENLIPFQDIDSLQMASLSIGVSSKSDFQKRLDSYQKMSHYQVGKEISTSKQKDLIAKLKQKDVAIVSLHNLSEFASKKFGLTSSTKNFIEALRQETKVVLVVFGTPYSLGAFDNIDWLFCAYEENEDSQDLAAQALYGAFSIRGRLPVTASPRSQFNIGVTTNSLFRLGYGLPESVGLNAQTLERGIAAVMKEGINAKAMPGGVVLVAKDGKVVFEKSYGYHTYNKKNPMTTTDIFDLASVTKIAAATVSVMKLQDEGKISIYQPLSNYLSNLQNTDKKDLLIQDIMAHRAGLKAWIKFYEQTTTTGKKPRPSRAFYKDKSSAPFTVPVTEKLFLRDDIPDTLWSQIRTSPLRSNTNYKYSDLGFYLMADLVKETTGQTLDRYVQNNFYRPLGLQTATYNPAKKFSLTRIPPTEEDSYFRAQRVHGYVHDMGAAMLGGVSGHAGLFANANDLAIIMQMLLNKGYYGGQRFLSSNTVQTFTTRHPKETRRGIGFDMLQLDTSVDPNLSRKASPTTFGHLGFTGTCVWADPEHNLVYIFLSNRTYPSMNNRKFGRMDIRPRIQDVIYDAIEPLN